MSQLCDVRLASALLEKRVRILTSRQQCHVDIEAFADQKLTTSCGCALPGGVRVITKDRLRREPVQQVGLCGRECGAAGRHDRQTSGLINLRKIEIAFDD